jgi:hypothetical protein
MINEIGVSVKDFGAVGDGVANDTAAIQAAIDAGDQVVIFPPGNYAASGLTQSVSGQAFVGIGRVTILKNDNGVLLTASGRDWSAENIVFDGRSGGFSGGCILGTGDAQRLSSCGARSLAGYAVELRGSSCEIIGTNDIYFTDDASAGPLKIGNTGSPLSLYNRIIGIKTSTSAGKILFQNAGTTWLIGSQTGSIDVPFGSGISMAECRVVGNLVFHGSFCQASDTTISGNLTIGDGVNSISSVVIAASVIIAGSSTVTINSGIRESVINTSQMSGVTIIDNLTGSAGDINNTFYGRPTAYTPVWGGGDGTQSVGNGTLTAQYTRRGRSIAVTFNFQAGSTTTFGTGAAEYTFSLPVKSRNFAWQYGSGEFNASLNYISLFRVSADDNKFVVLTDNYAGGARYNRPELWVSGCRLRGAIEYETA